MRTPKELFESLGNRGEYAALPSVTMEEVEQIWLEGYREAVNDCVKAITEEFDKQRWKKGG